MAKVARINPESERTFRLSLDLTGKELFSVSHYKPEALQLKDDEGNVTFELYVYAQDKAYFKSGKYGINLPVPKTDVKVQKIFTFSENLEKEEIIASVTNTKKKLTEIEKEVRKALNELKKETEEIEEV